MSIYLKSLRLFIVLIIGVLFLLGSGSSDNSDKSELIIELDRPIFTSPDEINFTENSTESIIITATDLSNLSFEINGEDRKYFRIYTNSNSNQNQSSATLDFLNAPDYETKKVYRLTIIADDGFSNNKITQELTINIVDVEEEVMDSNVSGDITESTSFVSSRPYASSEPIIENTSPIFTSLNSVSVNENQTSAITLRAKDEGSIIYSISGTDASYFNVDSSTGVVTFKSAPDYESKNFYTFIAKATNTQNYSSTESISITILDVVEISESDYFIILWDINTSRYNEVMIPTVPEEDYDFTIDWGDGTINKNVTTDIIHIYNSSQIYRIKIFGKFPMINFPTYTYHSLLSVEQWGSIKWKSMKQMFQSHSKLVINASDSPDLSNVRDMSFMFYDIKSINQDIGNWDVSNVTNMSHMFAYLKSFNQNLSTWDVSNVTNMSNMFASCILFNQDIGSWDISNVTDTSYMFWNSYKFNQNIGNWNTSSVITMQRMFDTASEFNQDIGRWDVSNIITMEGMFRSTKFNQDIGNWDVSNVRDMSTMFQYTNFNQNIGNWNVTSVKDMSSMFYNAWSFNKNITNWDVSNVTDMKYMFYGASSFSNQNLSSWNVSKVTDHRNFSNGWGTGNTEANWNQ